MGSQGKEDKLLANQINRGYLINDGRPDREQSPPSLCCIAGHSNSAFFFPHCALVLLLFHRVMLTVQRFSKHAVGFGRFLRRSFHDYAGHEVQPLRLLLLGSPVRTAFL